MSLVGTRPSVVGGATAVRIASNPQGSAIGKEVTVEVNNTSANSVYLGGSTAATASVASRTVPTATSKVVTLTPGDSLYCFAATTSAIEVLANGS